MPNRTTTKVYDLLNRVTSSTDPAGVVTSTSYDGATDAVSRTANGVTTTAVFDGLGRATSETDGGITTTTHVYDGQGRETSTTVSSSGTTVRVFDYAGRLTSETEDSSGLGLITSRTYDRLGHELTTTDPAGVLSTNTLDRLGRVTRTVTSGGGTTTTTDTGYDAVGNVLTRTEPYASGQTPIVTQTTYDALDRATTVIANYIAGSPDPAANLTTVSYYDANGRSLATKDAKGIVSRSFVNIRGLATKTVANCTDAGTQPPADPAACLATGTHDGATNLTAVMTFDGDGTLLTMTKQATTGNSETDNTYDALGRLMATVVDPTGLALTTQYGYDTSGRQIATKDPRGTISRTFFDTAGRVSKTVMNCTTTGTTIPTTGWESCAGTGTADATWNLTTTYTYDAAGNKTSETGPNGRMTTFAYDDANRLTSQTENYVASPIRADQNLTTYFFYDDDGRQVAVKAPTADRSTFIVTRTIYDGLGRVTSLINNCVDAPVGAPDACTGSGATDAQTNLITSYTYDARGNRLSTTAPDPSATSGTSPATITTRYAYDANDRLCRVLEAATVDLQTLADPCATAVAGTTTTNLSTRYGYDAGGILTSMIDGRGNMTTYGYDANGRMTSLTDPNSKMVGWAYDARGNRLSQTNRDLSVVSWTYDKADRMASRLAGGVTTTYGYDDNGNRTSVTAAGGTISTTYDRLNRPLTVTDGGDAGAATTFTYSFTSSTRVDPSSATAYSFTLDAFARELTMADPIHGAGAPWTTTYRADAQPASLATPNGNTTVYTYNAAGRQTELKTTSSGQVTRADYTYSLNRAGQRLSEGTVTSGDPTNGTVTFAYDTLGRLTGYSGAPLTSQTYAWDKVPNRISQQIGPAAAVTTTFDAANRPTSDSSGGTYSSDFDGRLTGRPGQTLVWDSLGRLTTVKDGTGAVIAAYTYDPLDRLLTVSHGAAITKFRYIGTTPTIAQARDGADVVQYNVATGLAGDARFDFVGGGVSQRFYGSNGHHDLTWVADATGAVIATLRYDPWGNIGTTSGSSHPDFRFQGSWADSTANLSWVLTRWYAPSLGRFITEDGLNGTREDPQGQHLFAYGEGDSVGRWDPDGRFWYFVRPNDTLGRIADKYLGRMPDGASRWPTIFNLNRWTIFNPSQIRVGQCIWVGYDASSPIRIEIAGNPRTMRDQCGPGRIYVKALDRTGNLYRAAKAFGISALNLSRSALVALTKPLIFNRARDPDLNTEYRTYISNYHWSEAYVLAIDVYKAGCYTFQGCRRKVSLVPPPSEVRRMSNGSYILAVYHHPYLPFSYAAAETFGRYVYIKAGVSFDTPVQAHEYIHLLQEQAGGAHFAAEYTIRWIYQSPGLSNRFERIAYLWQGWMETYPYPKELPPWRTWLPIWAPITR